MLASSGKLCCWLIYPFCLSLASTTLKSLFFFFLFLKFLAISPCFLAYSGACAHVAHDIAPTTFCLAFPVSAIYSHLSDLLWLALSLGTLSSFNPSIGHPLMTYLSICFISGPCDSVDQCPSLSMRRNRTKLLLTKLQTLQFATFCKSAWWGMPTGLHEWRPGHAPGSGLRKPNCLTVLLCSARRR